MIHHVHTGGAAHPGRGLLCLHLQRVQAARGDLLALHCLPSGPKGWGAEGTGGYRSLPQVSSPADTPGAPTFCARSDYTQGQDAVISHVCSNNLLGGIPPPPRPGLLSPGRPMLCAPSHFGWPCSGKGCNSPGWGGGVMGAYGRLATWQGWTMGPGMAVGTYKQCQPPPHHQGYCFLM